MKYAARRCLFIVLYLVASLAFYWGMLHLFGAITDGMRSFFEILPVTLLGVLVLFSLFLAYRHVELVSLTKRGALAYLVIAGVSCLLSLILISYYHSFYFEDSTHLVDRIAVLTEEVVILLFMALLIYWLRQGQFTKTLSPAFHPEGYKTRYPKAFRVYLFFLAGIGSYYLGNGLLSLFRFQNFAISPVVYPSLLFFILVPAANLLYFLFPSPKKDRAGVHFALTLLSLIGLFACWYAAFDEIVKVGQGIFYLEFAIEFPIGEIHLFILDGIFGYLTLKQMLSKKAAGQKPQQLSKS